MNKRNFGRVIKRIEARPEKWDQGRVARTFASNTCGSAYCFLGHAEILRTKSSKHAGHNLAYSGKLAAWLGIDLLELHRVFDVRNNLEDFKRWHKAGRVS